MVGFATTIWSIFYYTSTGVPSIDILL